MKDGVPDLGKGRAIPSGCACVRAAQSRSGQARAERDSGDDDAILAPIDSELV